MSLVIVFYDSSSKVTNSDPDSEEGPRLVNMSGFALCGVLLWTPENWAESQNVLIRAKRSAQVPEIMAFICKLFIWLENLAAQMSCPGQFQIAW